jgi:hypothetical protein
MNDRSIHQQLVNALAIVSWVLAYLLTGRLVWHWISPENFGTVLAFVVTWIILGYLAQTALFLTVTLIARAIGPQTK